MLEGAEQQHPAGAAANWAEEVDGGRDEQAVSALAPPMEEDVPSPARTATMLSASILQAPYKLRWRSRSTSLKKGMR